MFTLLVETGAITLHSWRSFKLLKSRLDLERLTKVLDHRSKNNNVPEDVRDMLISNKVQANRAEVESELMFWVIFALLFIYQFYFEVFVSWVPFYDTVKFVLLVYCVFPNTHGAQVVYREMVSPYLKRPVAYFDARLFPVIHSSGSLLLSMGFLLSTQTHHFASLLTDNDLDDIHEQTVYMLQMIEAEKSKRGRPRKPSTSTTTTIISAKHAEEVVSSVVENVQKTIQDTVTSVISSRSKRNSSTSSMDQNDFVCVNNTEEEDDDLDAIIENLKDDEPSPRESYVSGFFSWNRNYSKKNAETNATTTSPVVSPSQNFEHQTTRSLASVAETLEQARIMAQNIGMPHIVSPSKENVQQGTMNLDRSKSPPLPVSRKLLSTFQGARKRSVKDASVASVSSLSSNTQKPLEATNPRRANARLNSTKKST